MDLGIETRHRLKVQDDYFYSLVYQINDKNNLVFVKKFSYKCRECLKDTAFYVLPFDTPSYDVDTRSCGDVILQSVCDECAENTVTCNDRELNFERIVAEHSLDLEFIRHCIDIFYVCMGAPHGKNIEKVKRISIVNDMIKYAVLINGQDEFTSRHFTEIYPDLIGFNNMIVVLNGECIVRYSG